MDYLSTIKQPIEGDLSEFITLFEQSLTHQDGMLSSALSHIRKRGGKRMRPTDGKELWYYFYRYSALCRGS